MIYQTNMGIFVRYVKPPTIHGTIYQEVYRILFGGMRKFEMMINYILFTTI